MSGYPGISRRSALASGAGIFSAALFASGRAEARPNGGDNRRLVKDALEAWRAGHGHIAELLADEVRWTIVGRSLVSGTTEGKRDLVDQVLGPFGERFSISPEPFRPTVIHGLYADGDMVVAYFDGAGLANDGITYANSYAWFMRFEGERVIECTAFFDSVAFNEFWTRVKPAEHR